MRVIKVGGRVQSDPRLAEVIATAWRAAPGALCVVHGGGDEMTALQRSLGHSPVFVGGRRVTEERDLELLRMTLSGSANKRLVSSLVSLGLPAVGISGEDAGLLGARRVPDESLGFVGMPERIEARLVRYLLDGGFLPVISPVARDTDAPRADAPGGAAAGALNVNGDDAAAALAAALGAEELLLVADVAGVLANGGGEMALVAELDAAGAEAMITAGEASGGMVAKLEAALRALELGVAQVRIGDLNALLSPEHGTLITHARSLA